MRPAPTRPAPCTFIAHPTFCRESGTLVLIAGSVGVERMIAPFRPARGPRAALNVH